MSDVTDLKAEVLLLRRENAKLRELAQLQDELAKAVHKYWASSERSLDDFNAMMAANNKVLTLRSELGIEVDG